MKKISFIALAVLTAMTSTTIYASCESIKESIKQKIINKGVKEDTFSLDIVPNEQVDVKHDKVIGHCDKNRMKIIYKKLR